MRDNNVLNCGNGQNLQFWFAENVRSSKMLVLHLFNTSAKLGHIVDV